MRTRGLCFAALVVALPASALYACGSKGGGSDFGDGGSSSGGSSGGSDGSLGGDSALCLTCGDGGHFDGIAPVFEDGGFSAGDCDGGGCSFPPPGAPTCANAPPINISYPTDDTLVPPNMNVISVMWTPFGSAYKTFEVDFTNGITYMHVVTKCATQTVDTEQPPKPSGGCELQLDPAMWSFLAGHNAGQDFLKVTVRGTTDGTCASTSTNTVSLGFGQQPILGAIYYWKSTVTASGTGGDVWVKSWGDSTPEQNITVGFRHVQRLPLALARRPAHGPQQRRLRLGRRVHRHELVAHRHDDPDADRLRDDGAVRRELPGLRHVLPRPQPVPLVERLHGRKRRNRRRDRTTCTSYDGTSGTLLTTATAAPPAMATMPDWSPDGKSVVFVAPQAIAKWTGVYGDSLDDDTHVFGGSLYTMPYSGGSFGPASVFLMSGGENNYYPSYSPDGSFVVFNRAALDNSAGSLTACKASGMQASCPNDSFSNPNARLMLMKNMAGSTPVDLANANGSPASSPLAWSNSWPSGRRSCRATRGTSCSGSPSRPRATTASACATTRRGCSSATRRTPRS